MSAEGRVGRGIVKEEKGKADGVGGVPRVAASSYLNTAPLVWSFARGPRRGEIELITDTAPARCADMLARGQAEAALVPVIEYQRLPETALVPGVCVGAREEVHSVVLATRRARLEDVRSVALDTSSRTSAALVEIIFREFLGRAPRLEQSAPNLEKMLDAHDAALVIGDPAMTFPRERLRVYDMAALWREHTGLGFVFAMRSEEHTSELQSRSDLVCRLLLEKKKIKNHAFLDGIINTVAAIIQLISVISATAHSSTIILSRATLTDKNSRVYIRYNSRTKIPN